MNWKSNTLIFLTYNNYYNRIVKKEETLQDYLEYELFRLSATNFNPADGVNTTHIVNMADGLYPDYIIIVDEHNQIVSRWFIIESDRIRGGQYTLTLHRDLMVDYYDNIVDAPCFIEKATLTAEDPLLFNNEDMSFNEIKQSELALKDNTRCPWIVGYYAKNAETSVLSGTVAINPVDDIYDILIDVPFENWKFNKKNLKSSINNVHYRIYGKNTTSGTGFQAHHGYVAFNINGVFAEERQVLGISPSLSFDFNYTECVNQMLPYFKEQKATLLEQAKTYLPEVLTESELSEYLSLKNNTIVKDSLGKYYSVSLLREADTYATVPIKSGSLYNSLANIVSKSERMEGSPNTSSFEIVGGFVTYSLEYVELTNLATTWNMAEHSRLITEDAPYNIFAIPFGNCTLYNGVTKIVKSAKEYALPLAQSIINKMGNALYDIQLLPYCPVSDIRYEIVDTKTPEAYSLVKDGDGNPVTFILNVPSSNFSRNLTYEIKAPETAIEIKINNECDKYRLCSPNFNGYFDFTSAKNGGVQYFNVDCYLKPFQPYIHINPNFNELYGRDFDDPRGLVCGGDFSLSQIENQWQQYQINNKNFQEMFDRQIQNMEVNNKYQRQQDIANAVAGTVQGGMSGAATGLMASGGNPYAAAAGAVVGTVTGGVGGIMDLHINQALRNEALDFTKDNFGYQLGNIKALPYTLTKVSSFNNNNKIFPILEYYTCTDREKEALANKLAYNGMTVMAIGTLQDYIGNSWSYKDITDKGYIKGKLIRLPEIEEDFHIANEIAKELNMGVYIGGNK